MLPPSTTMSDLQAAYDDAMYEYSLGNYAGATEGFVAILAEDPQHFDAQLSLAMCHYRMGDYPTAIREGLKARDLKPNEQLVHTNLSLFYMKSGDKTTAEHHGLQARIAGWKQDMSAPGAQAAEGDDSSLKMAESKPKPMKLPEKFPDTPWKRKIPPPPAAVPPSAPAAGNLPKP
jgi:tetratricopeptide (TPR) repeat protein